MPRRLLRGPLATTLLGVAALAGACVPDDGEPAGDPNAGLLRDFVDGKFDAAGHPLNARVTEAEALCASAGAAADGAVRLAGSRCSGPLPGAQQVGDLVASVRVRVQSHAPTGEILQSRITRSGGAVLAAQALTASQLRHTGWIDVPLTWTSDGSPATIELVAAASTVLDVDYVEVFPQRFGLVAAPGSGEYGDQERIVLELPRLRKLDRVELDDVDLSARLASLVASGEATRTTTELRTLIDVRLADLAPDRDELAELELRAGSLAARMQLRRAPTPCAYEGDAGGVKVLVTGFQPFPADGWHENVSAVAIRALDPNALPGVQVLRVVMPVEYDRAAAQVRDLIARCAPDAVLSFGQGGDAIALEEVAYNLQDTGEVPGGVPDNRGVIRAAAVIDPAAPATRDTLLPLAAIAEALEQLGEQPRLSRDPGRYICNNVMFAGVGEMAARGGRAGFIHLPYETRFDDAVRARYAGVVRAAVLATAAALR